MRLAITILFIFFMPVCASAKDLGKMGNTYIIAEPDAFQEIRSRLKQVDMRPHLNKLRSRAENFKPDNLPALKTAVRGSTFTVNLTYTLDHDITDGRGNMIYPKGYTFNPLDYIRYNKTIVVINGARQNQVKWFRESEYSKDMNTMLLITDGSYHRLGEKLKRQVFYANAHIVDKFRLKAAPAVIRQKGNVLEVKEIAIQ